MEPLDHSIVYRQFAIDYLQRVGVALEAGWFDWVEGELPVLQVSAQVPREMHVALRRAQA